MYKEPRQKGTLLPSQRSCEGSPLGQVSISKSAISEFIQLRRLISALISFITSGLVIILLSPAFVENT